MELENAIANAGRNAMKFRTSIHLRAAEAIELLLSNRFAHVEFVDEDGGCSRDVRPGERGVEV
jgi:hypothetical protein